MLSNTCILVILGICMIQQYHAAPVDNDSDIQILKYNSESDGSGVYEFEFETSDGTKRREKSQIQKIDEENVNIIVHGEYEYIGPDGHVYKVTYTADENGFHPSGDHLPMIPTMKKVFKKKQTRIGLTSAISASLLG